MAVLGIGKGREDGEGNLFRVITHEASKPVFKDDGGPPAIDKRFLDESIEKKMQILCRCTTHYMVQYL